MTPPVTLTPPSTILVLTGSAASASASWWVDGGCAVKCLLVEATEHAGTSNNFRAEQSRAAGQPAAGRPATGEGKEALTGRPGQTHGTVAVTGATGLHAMRLAASGSEQQVAWRCQPPAGQRSLTCRPPADQRAGR